MSDEERTVRYIDLEPVAPVIFLVVMGIGVGIFFLARGVSRGSATAYLALGGIVAIALLFLGVALTLVIVSYAARLTERREQREQARFRDNTKENLALMEAMARTQAQQAKMQATHTGMLLQQARDQGRLLAAPQDVVDVPAIDFDESMLDILDEED